MNNSDNKTQFNLKVKELFSRCVDAELEQQKQLLAQSNASDKVKAMVESLLGFENSNDSQLTGAINKSVNLSLGEEALKAGDLIDTYLLVEPIGIGGQGEVWLAERNDGEFTHTVAIKFIKLSHSEQELLRFKTERELLASLRHANIAQLIGGGTYQNKRLYMILEWVDGLSIIEYARKNLSSIKDYLLCFEQVCQAVKFAHSNGIIHRDLKPSNIIVTNDGTVKLLDFGIAKNIDADITSTKSDMMMTFAYSSPEQINGQTVSTATDIYALGLILYELLCCKKAQDQNTESHAEMIHNISEITPVIPSKIDFDTTLNFTSKKLQGDLDNLVMMAIRKEPQRRYNTVQDMILDLNNYLNSKPLVASGDSLAYKFNKLIKRNPAASVFAAIVLAFLIALPIYMYKTNAEIKMQRDIANESSDFLINILKSASPLGVNGKETRLSDVLAMGERQIEFKFEDQKQLKAKMYDTLGQIQHNIGNNQKAIEHYQESEKIYIVLNDRVGQLKSLGQQALYASWLSQIEKSEALITKADSIVKNVTDTQAIAWHHMRKATLLHESNNHVQAEELLMATLELLKREKIKDEKIYGRLYLELSISLRYKDKELALHYSQKALELAKSSLGYNHPIYQSRLVSKVYRLIELEKYEQARIALNESLELAERLFSHQHQRYARVLGVKGIFHHNLGEFEQAEADYSQAIEVFKNTYGVDSRNYALNINRLAYLYEDMGKYSQAEELYKQSITSHKRLNPDNILNIVLAEANLAKLFVKTGKYQQADALMGNVVKQYTLKGRNNLYNYLIVAAINIRDGSDEIQCNKGLQQIDRLIPELQKQSAKGWRRMYAELWIGQLAMSCREATMAHEFLDAAQKKSQTIYQKGSQGQSLIAQRIMLIKKQSDSQEITQ